MGKQYSAEETNARFILLLRSEPGSFKREDEIAEAVRSFFRGQLPNDFSEFHSLCDQLNIEAHACKSCTSPGGTVMFR